MSEDFQVGGFIGPLTAATTNAPLSDADPALAACLDYFAAMLATYIGPRFDAEVTACGLTALVGKVSSTAVPYDPAPYLTAAQLTPPLLALYAVEDTWTEETRHHVHVESLHKLQWVLPPLTAAQALRLVPFLRAVTKVIVDRTEQGNDPTYQGGARVFGLAGIEAIKIQRAAYGTIESLKGDMHFPAVEIDVLISERCEAPPTTVALAGIDGTTSVVDASGSHDLIAWKKDLT